MEKSNPISEKTRGDIADGHRNGKRPLGDSNEKTVAALDILGRGQSYGAPGGPLGPKGRPAHDKALYAEDSD